MPQQERDFKGIWIPKEIWLSRVLSIMEKVLLVEIHSLDRERGCYAKNSRFAKFFGVSERQIRTYIRTLKEKDFINVTIVNRNDRSIVVNEWVFQSPQCESNDSPECGNLTDQTAKPVRNFKGIWIPKDIWLSEQLSIIEKVLFVEIHSLDNEYGCIASNRYFADFFGVKERQIRTYIGNLKQNGFVYVTVQNNFERSIRVVAKYARVKKKDLQIFNNTRHELIHSMTLREQGVGRKTPGG